jgi:hypothetical protein
MELRVVFSLITPSENLLQPQVFIKQFLFANDYERQYVRQISKQALANKNRIYMLVDELNTPFGFVALSVGSIHNMPPCIIIDYLFTSLPHRNAAFAELSDCKISQFLIGSAMNVAKAVNHHVPIHFLALQPAHEKLERFYTDFGFTRLHHREWMFLKI